MNQVCPIPVFTAVTVRCHVMKEKNLNERIKELLDKATTIEEHGWGASYENFDREKFADSIVWECMKICEDVMKKDNSALACWSEIKGTFRS